jgi:hypothetical protein
VVWGGGGLRAWRQTCSWVVKLARFNWWTATDNPPINSKQPPNHLYRSQPPLQVITHNAPPPPPQLGKREEECRDVARLALRSPWWSLRSYGDCVAMAQLEGGSSGWFRLGWFFGLGSGWGLGLL